MYYFYIIGYRLVSSLPRNICYSIAKFFSILHFYTSKKDKEALFYNLSPIVEDKAKLKKYIKEVFINFSYYLVDFFRSSKLNRSFIEKYIKVKGLENVDRCLAQGRGAIILSAHLGNYELAGAITSLLGYPLSVVALPHKDERINRFFDEQRRRVGVKVIPTGAAVKGCFSALKGGDLVAFLGDKNFSKGGLKLKMFSRFAYFPRGVAFFALKAGVSIIPAFLVRENKNFYQYTFEEPIDCGKGNNKDEASIAKQYISILEKYIKKYPQQWYMFEKYWLPE